VFVGGIIELTVRSDKINGNGYSDAINGKDGKRISEIAPPIPSGCNQQVKAFATFLYGTEFHF